MSDAEPIIRIRGLRNQFGEQVVHETMTSKRIRTRKGEIMKFLSLEDLTGTFEVVIFPKVYNIYAGLTASMGPYLVDGKIDMNDENNLIAEKIEILTSLEIKQSFQKDSVDHNYYGDKEKITEEEFYIVEKLGAEKLRRAYAV